jgi:glycosyltransferase involved in cell wall biosynthesis
MSKVDDVQWPLRVCYFGTYREEYGRNQILIAGLREQGVELLICHHTLWQGIEDRVAQASGRWRSFSFVRRVVAVYWRLWRQHRRLPDYDVMVLGYPGQFDAFLGRALSWSRGKPLALDLYMSLYLIAVERGLTAKSPFTGRLIRWLEMAGLRLPDLLIADTAEYVDYHCRTYKLQPERFCLVPAGADDRFFYPRPEHRLPDDHIRLIYYGTFIPNHAVLTIIQAAALLRDQPEIQFVMYGEGPDLPEALRLTEELNLINVTFCGWADKENLPIEVARSHICLGAFGDTPQSLMTVQNKIWEMAAMQKAIISGDSTAVRREFTHLKEIYLIPRKDPSALAKAIVHLAQTPELRQQLGTGARASFENGHNIAGLGATLKAILQTTT